MGMTITQKILAAHTELDNVEAGELININLDMVLASSISEPASVEEFNKAGYKEVFDKDKIAIVIDPFLSGKCIEGAETCKLYRDFAKKFDINHFYDIDEGGIEPSLLPEKGLVSPGDTIIGTDSNASAFGALGAFSVSTESSDIASSFAHGNYSLKVPSAIRVHLRGELSPYVSGKDVILHILGTIGQEGALYKSMEFTGPGVESLSMDDRFTMSNMAIEAGSINAIFPVDDVTKKYLKGRLNRNYPVYDADPDANYDAIYDVNLSDITSTVAFPDLPENNRTFDEIPEIKIDCVIIGSATNGRFSDIKSAWEIIKGRHIVNGVRAILIPATTQIYKECIQKGYIVDFIDAGFTIFPPTSAPCIKGCLNILTEGESCISTTNKNSIGFMGHENSEIYLASPAVAAASALTGIISDPRIVDSKAERKAEKKAEKKLDKAEKLADKAEKAAIKAKTAAKKPKQKA